jgi:hypothetical protein
MKLDIEGMEDDVLRELFASRSPRPEALIIERPFRGMPDHIALCVSHGYRVEATCYENVILIR